jgi:hypothetical protein
VRVLDEERHITESLEYDFIKLLPFLLMDESQLEIGQFNFVNETYNTEPGVHFIEHTDEDGVILRHFIVRHAKSIQRPFVKNEDGSRVDIPILGELYEALMALERDLVQNEPVNRNPIDVTQYPRLSLDIEFDMIVTNPSL